MSLQESLKGKKVLVTGAGRGIGRAVVKRLHEYGAEIYALSKNPENLRTLKAECPKIIQTIAVDLSDWDATRKALSTLPPLDCLLNNAGFGFCTTLMGSSQEIFDQHFQVNVKGTLNVSQVVAQKMIEGGKGGSIVFISSIAGVKPFPAFSIYGMTKASLEMMAKLLAVELGPHKIKVNIVRPAAVETDMLVVAETGVAKLLGPADAFEQFMKSRSPYPGYHMEMDSVVNLILFHLSNLAPQVTGDISTIDAGFQLT